MLNQRSSIVLRIDLAQYDCGTLSKLLLGCMIKEGEETKLTGTAVDICHHRELKKFFTCRVSDKEFQRHADCQNQARVFIHLNIGFFGISTATMSVGHAVCMRTCKAIGRQWSITLEQDTQASYIPRLYEFAIRSIEALQ